jgi:ankyrin repeat protein
MVNHANRMFASALALVISAVGCNGYADGSELAAWQSQGGSSPVSATAQTPQPPPERTVPSGPAPAEFVNAAVRGDVDAVRSHLEAGVHPDSVGQDGFGALHAAARNGHVEVMRLLVEAGADPNFQAPGGHAVLHWAARSGQYDVVELLLAHGADAHILNDGGTSPLDYAAGNNFRQVVLLLYRHGGRIADARWSRGG